MWAWLRHPLTVALVGIVITGVLVPYVARRWQNQQKALEVRGDLVADMSECAMGLIARIQGVQRLMHGSRLSRKQQGKLRDARARLNDERQKFEIREAVIGTKLEVYFGSSDIPDRWTTLARALADLAEVEGSGDALRKPDHRAALQGGLQLEGLLERKRRLIQDVLHASWEVFPTSWNPWRR